MGEMNMAARNKLAKLLVGTRSKPELREDRGAPSRLMGIIEGWAMVRRPGAAPYLISEKEWMSLPVLSRSTSKEEGNG